MKPWILGGFCCVLLVALSGCNLKTPLAAGQSGLDGSWENISPSLNPNLRQVRHNNGNQFVWIIYDRNTKTTVLMSGGTCSLQGSTYKEVIEYCSPGIQEKLLGQEQVLTVQFQGDQVTFSGVLSSGVRINETYRRTR